MQRNWNYFLVYVISLSHGKLVNKKDPNKKKNSIGRCWSHTDFVGPTFWNCPIRASLSSRGPNCPTFSCGVPITKLCPTGDTKFQLWIMCSWILLIHGFEWRENNVATKGLVCFLVCWVELCRRNNYYCLKNYAWKPYYCVHYTYWNFDIKSTKILSCHHFL